MCPFLKLSCQHCKFYLSEKSIRKTYQTFEEYCGNSGCSTQYLITPQYCLKISLGHHIRSTDCYQSSVALLPHIEKSNNQQWQLHTMQKIDFLGFLPTLLALCKMSNLFLFEYKVPFLYISIHITVPTLRYESSYISEFSPEM